MDFQPGVTQKHLLFTLLFTGQEPAMSKTTPPISVKQRKELVDADLITLEKRGRSTHIRPTDKAWTWALDHLDQPVPRALKLNAHALEGLLKGVKAHLTATHLSLADLLRPAEARQKTAPDPEKEAEKEALPIPENQNFLPSMAETPLEERIRTAYYELTGGTWQVRVRIADLHRSLEDVPMEHLARTLRRMQLQENTALVLYPCDDPREIGPEDAAAAVDIGGEKNHILYMGG